MGIRIRGFGEVQPICSECGVALCWSIEEMEYFEWRRFWDDWKCKVCNENYIGAYEKYKLRHKPFELV